MTVRPFLRRPVKRTARVENRLRHRTKMRTVLLICATILAAAGASAEPAAQAAVQPHHRIEQGATVHGDAAACAPGAPGPALLVTVTGFKSRDGQTRLKLYSDRQDEFLKSPQELTAAGKIFVRADIPTPLSGDAVFCLVPPGPGHYTLNAFHDRNEDGEVDIWRDGFGFSNNPKLGFGAPKAAQAAFSIQSGVLPMRVVLNYVIGLMPQPLKNPR